MCGHRADASGGATPIDMANKLCLLCSCQPTFFNGLTQHNSLSKWVENTKHEHDPLK